MNNDFVEIRDNSIALSSVEAYKVLRTNLIYSEGVQVIAVTSALANEGKTVTSYNLAKSFAQINKRVLLIDADLRKGSLKRYFKLSKRVVGLSEALTRQSGEIILETTNPNLDVIFSGKIPPNPTELLSSDIFENIIHRLRGVYDYIIIDTPPMSVAVDAAIIGRITDGIILVVRNDFVKKQTLKRLKISVERNGARIIGTVLNRVTKEHIDYQNYGYEYEYK